MREVEIVAACLHYQVDKLLHVRIETLQVERNQLWYVKLQVLPHGRSEIGIDATLG